MQAGEERTEIDTLDQAPQPVPDDPVCTFLLENDRLKSTDLKRAVIQVSIIGTDEEREACVEALRHAQGFIRSCLAKDLKRMRSIPELIFQLDRGPEYSQRISDLLEKLHDHEHEST